MRILWTVVRILVILVALATTFVTALFAEGPAGRTILLDGLIIDLIALGAIIVAAFSLWRDRRALA